MLKYLEVQVEEFLFDAKLIYNGLYKASRIFSHTTLKERKQLFNLARRCSKQAIALEIGSFLGSSACFLAAGLRQVGGHLYCVDTWNNETHPEGPRNTFPDFQRNTERYSSAITPIRKRSEHLKAEDLSLPLDIAFLDGDHSESAVAKDFALISPWIKSGGILVFHDCVYFPGVARVVGAALLKDEWQLTGFVDNMIWLTKRDVIASSD